MTDFNHAQAWETRRSRYGRSGQQFVVHGHASRGRPSRTYKAWAKMWARCTRPTEPRYSRYGGRGICICERWRDFRNFLADMGECPPKHSIERRNNDGNYEPSNCCWATAFEQMRNCSATKLTLEKAILIAGRALAGESHRKLAAEMGVSSTTIRSIAIGRTWAEAKIIAAQEKTK